MMIFRYILLENVDEILVYFNTKFIKIVYEIFIIFKSNLFECAYQFLVIIDVRFELLSGKFLIKIY